MSVNIYQDENGNAQVEGLEGKFARITFSGSRPGLVEIIFASGSKKYEEFSFGKGGGSSKKKAEPATADEAPQPKKKKKKSDD